MDAIREFLTSEQKANFTFIEGDIRDIATCRDACNGVDYISHQAALGSVPRSIEDPSSTDEVNVTGHLNILIAAKECGVKNVVYAASSSTYGDSPSLPKVEDVIGKPLSPYAVTKYVNELYADVFHRCYGLNSVGLRYFNVFGRRQDPNGAYAAVIPIWISRMINGLDITINGDGMTSRDFCYIDNVVQANILAALSDGETLNAIYNVAVGDNNTLLDLISLLKNNLNDNGISYSKEPIFGSERFGDIKHSQADISKAKKKLGYDPKFTLSTGLEQSTKWYISFLTKD
jgi:UDP-N-acetylglucosamine 4-epimerase